MNYVIGVDGGGTKTEAVAYNLDGEVLETSLTGFGNLVNGKDEALKNITDSIEKILEKLGKDGMKGLYLGIAGSEVSDNAKVIKEEIKEKFGFDSVVMNDGDLALKALLRGEDGILVIAGTGSIAFGINKDKEKRVGGWGHLLGDEGSAYKISIEAFKRMIKESDYGLERSALSQDILNKLKIEEVSNIIDFVYSSTKDEIAQMAGLVSKHAENGDEEARKILVNEGIQIAKSAERVFNALEFENCSIGLVGGVIRKSKVVREAFENYLQENIKVNAFIDDDVSAASGAYYIYKKENI
ncbi:BadF/BadG/BcrA/BcrD ATPase family protein [uncultured Clostridium sp.]|uniref:N-acetylglucosamine kinase n=1 Tax=uncultured Clostridium sp. TaxID=59620 RepID=UPI0026106C9C|nr:BadF/BadG/BcrA/BcrD ATPase family protein [uncultured Clostridium sp.]